MGNSIDANEPDHEVLTAAEVQRWLSIKRTKLYDLVEQGLPFVSLSAGGHTKRFLRSELKAWLASRNTSRAAAPLTIATAGPGRPRKGAARPPGANRWLGDYKAR